MTDTKVSYTTQPVRTSFLALIEPKERDKGPRFEATLLFPPGYDLSTLKKHIGDHMRAKFGDDIMKELSPIEKAKLPLKKCDDNKWFAEEFPGWHYVNAWSKFQPGMITQDLKPIMDPKKIYPGCWCSFQVGFYAYDNKEGGRGCLINLTHVMWLADDKKLGSVQDAGKAYEGVKFEIPEEMKNAAVQTAEESAASGNEASEEDLW